MIDITTDIQSLTTFKRNTSVMMKRIRKTSRPVVLTVKGKAEAVLMSPAGYQQLTGYVDAVRGIKRGLAQAKRGMGQTVDEVFDEIEADVSARRA
jgi:prevent-host-death family protein